MEAKEARNRATLKLTLKVDSQFDKIMKLIWEQSGQGKFEFNTYNSIIPEVQKKLIDLGYKIGDFQSDGPNEGFRTITW